MQDVVLSGSSDIAKHDFACCKNKKNGFPGDHYQLISYLLKSVFNSALTSECTVFLAGLPYLSCQNPRDLWLEAKEIQESQFAACNCCPK